MKRSIIREGKDKKGKAMRQLCGFCGTRFISRRQRFQHAKYCKK